MATYHGGGGNKSFDLNDHKLYVVCPHLCPLMQPIEAIVEETIGLEDCSPVTLTVRVTGRQS